MRKLGHGRKEFFIPDKVPYKLIQGVWNKYNFASNFVKNKVVLDVACGTGYGSSYLKKKGARVVIGGDISEEAIEYAKTHYEREGLSFICLDATNMPFSRNYFDVLISIETIEHIAEYKRYLSECSRVLKQKGLFFCTTPNKKASFKLPSGKPLNPVHVNEFTIDELSSLIEKHFTIIALYGHGRLTSMFKFENSLKLIGARLLSSIPKGDYLEGLIRKYLPPFKGTNLGTEVSVELIDKKYAVFPLKDNKVRGIVVVAEKKG
jgi:SAM-dependent methyltransferase